MKLFINRPSPYGRKVLVAAYEKNIVPRLEIVSVDPWSDPAELIAASPIGKVPALIMDDETVLADSTLIVSYFDEIGSGDTLFGTDRFAVLGRVAIAQGLIDAAFATVIERRRPADKQWDGWIARQRRAIDRIVAAVTASRQFDLGDVTLACGLSYLDFRLPDVTWRAARPDLAAWLDDVARRPSMQVSTP
jgi:glutathione S-transferase